MPSTIPSLARAIRVMNALAEGGEFSSLGLAKRLGISQSTCYRILQTLEDADWIRAENGGYAFSRGLLPFVKPLMDVENLVTALRPDMESLAQSTGLTVKLSRRQGAEQVTIARVQSPRPIALSSTVGARFPVVLGASGACLLSVLDDETVERLVEDADEMKRWEHESADELRQRIAACRARGICENIGNHPQGIDTISALLTCRLGAFALTLVGLRGDFKGSRRTDCRRLLLETAQRERGGLTQ